MGFHFLCFCARFIYLIPKFSFDKKERAKAFTWMNEIIDLKDPHIPTKQQQTALTRLFTDKPFPHSYICSTHNINMRSNISFYSYINKQLFLLL